MSAIDQLAAHVRASVAARQAVDLREQDSIDRFLAVFDTLMEPFSEDADPIHVTGSAIVVTPDRTHVLLHRHKRLGIWVQPGGHIEPALNLADELLRRHGVAKVLKRG